MRVLFFSRYHALGVIKNFPPSEEEVDGSQGGAVLGRCSFVVILLLFLTYPLGIVAAGRMGIVLLHGKQERFT